MKSEVDLNLMRKSGAILKEALKYAVSLSTPGNTPVKINQAVEAFIRSYDEAVPAFLGYNGFPASICISVNTEVVHGIPKDIPLVAGDLISLDCGVLYREHYSDAARTILISDDDQKKLALIKATRDALTAGIKKAVAGNRIGDVAFSIQQTAERQGFKVSPHFTGHGIGRILHGPPQVPNYGLPGQGLKLTAGMCLAIEPVIFAGKYGVKKLADNWTIISDNNVFSAHFEDTVIITNSSPEVIT